MNDDESARDCERVTSSFLFVFLAQIQTDEQWPIFFFPLKKFKKIAPPRKLHLIHVSYLGGHVYR